jgi:hypothetical protein
MLEGYVEAVDAAGFVSGWAWDGTAAAASVQLRHRGRVVAEGVADRFRADLLQAGRGHGHHAFRLRLRQGVPAGPATFEVVLPRRGGRAGGPARVIVPEASGRAVPLEALLGGAEAWTVAHVLAHPSCLDLAGALARMGAERFLDAVYRFALERWPTAAEIAAWTRLLTVQGVAPDVLLVELLGSPERVEMPPALLSPHDPRFGLAL